MQHTESAAGHVWLKGSSSGISVHGWTKVQDSRDRGRTLLPILITLVIPQVSPDALWRAATKMACLLWVRGLRKVYELSMRKRSM